MTVRILPLFFLLMAIAGPAGADDSSSSSSSSSTTGTTGSRPASIGQGFSLFSRIVSGTPSSYSVQCSCKDGSLSLKMCPTTSYLCSCQSKASVTCE